MKWPHEEAQQQIWAIRGKEKNNPWRKGKQKKKPTEFLILSTHKPVNSQFITSLTHKFARKHL